MISSMITEKTMIIEIVTIRSRLPVIPAYFYLDSSAALVSKDATWQEADPDTGVLADYSFTTPRDMVRLDVYPRLVCDPAGRRRPAGDAFRARDLPYTARGTGAGRPRWERWLKRHPPDRGPETPDAPASTVYDPWATR
jgi:hypothetical protein